MQQNYGDVCTLINVLNTVVNTFNDQVCERNSIPNLQESAWWSHKEMLELRATLGYGIKEILWLLCDKCGHQQKIYQILALIK